MRILLVLLSVLISSCAAYFEGELLEFGERIPMDGGGNRIGLVVNENGASIQDDGGTIILRISEFASGDATEVVKCERQSGALSISMKQRAAELMYKFDGGVLMIDLEGEKLRCDVAASQCLTVGITPDVTFEDGRPFSSDMILTQRVSLCRD